VHVTQIINNEKKEMHLCEQCARENEQIAFSSPFHFASPFSISDLLSGFLGKDFGYQVKPKEPSTMPRCSVCGITYDQFARSGKLGCANCYTVFNDALKPVFRRIHGNTYHHGKLPQRAGEKIKAKREIENLKTQLTKAVQNEEYEKAAELRDRIRELETHLNKPTDEGGSAI
jgi:protein arginine kinase activator